MSAQTPSRNRLLAGAAILAVIAGLGGYGVAKLTLPATPIVSTPEAEGRKALYYYDPMVPAQHFDKPGKSPFMDMQLVPRYGDEGGQVGQAPAGVRIDPAALQNLGVRLATVERGAFAQTIDAPGTLDFNQRDVAIVQARAAGFVQRVYARAPGDVVAAGAPIADLLIPTWGGAQAEYLAVARTGDPPLEAAARQRLRLLGMSDDVISEVARTGRPRTIVTITTPVGGAIQTLDVRKGMTVAMGQTLAQVSGLGTVWLNASVPEAVGGQVRVGQTVRAELAAFPGETFTGRVSAILPATQAESRTLQVRVELPNRGGRLRPGMFATVHLGGESHPSLSVASEAVIRTGKRTLVMLAGAGGRFQPVEVQVGREQGDRTEILAGLEEGQKVVASGQFLIDSEASLAGVQARPLTGAAMAGPMSAAAAKPPKTPAFYETRGRIETLSGDQITLSHEPVPAIGWPAMTMTFRLDPPVLAKGHKVGDRVVFAFEQKPEGPVIHKLTPTGAAR
jgi:Cu(I)/Ag(I) efflux system membrane fusion protein